MFILERKYSREGIMGMERAMPQEESLFGWFVQGGRRCRRGLWSLLELQPGLVPQVAKWVGRKRLAGAPQEHGDTFEGERQTTSWLRKWPLSLSAWLQVLVVPFPCHVSLGGWLNLSEPQTGHKNNISLIRQRR